MFVYATWLLASVSWWLLGLLVAFEFGGFCGFWLFMWLYVALG